ncbi:MAG: PfkB family carbohydrate kinase [Leptolyngbyaceae cyanobacterium bins.59]|nr:PfkB family carbohydrate kinase [Leptolyngbyaceae cyanobacterium bins.59]
MSITPLSMVMEGFHALKVIVLGEAMLDRYLDGTADRLCQEAPVPVVQLQQQRDMAGGAANAAMNVQNLGGQAILLSVVGKDQEGECLEGLLQNQGVVTDYLLHHPRRHTLAKHRVLANSHLLLRYDQGTTTPIDPITEQLLIERLTNLFFECDGVLVSDYNYGILTPQIIQTLKELQARSPRVWVVDARNFSAYRTLGVTAVKPNYREATQLLGIPQLSQDVDRTIQMMSYREQLLNLTGAELVAVTLDTAGALLLQRGCLPYRVYATPHPSQQTMGAGDTFVAALTLALGAGASPTIATELAAAAAAIGIEKEGTAVCTGEELRAYFAVDNFLPFSGMDMKLRVSAD